MQVNNQADHVQPASNSHSLTIPYIISFPFPFYHRIVFIMYSPFFLSSLFIFQIYLSPIIAPTLVHILGRATISEGDYKKLLDWITAANQASVQVGCKRVTKKLAAALKPACQSIGDFILNLELYPDKGENEQSVLENDENAENWLISTDDKEDMTKDRRQCLAVQDDVMDAWRALMWVKGGPPTDKFVHALTPACKAIGHFEIKTGQHHKSPVSGKTGQPIHLVKTVALPGKPKPASRKVSKPNEGKKLTNGKSTTTNKPGWKA